ncbi:MAG: hypothetical protein JJU11_15360 [Candidatus Sumerlaeia bacterium]|nr:hypothetical protein [Candidatus Sumerlaeia bacterium]
MNITRWWLRGILASLFLLTSGVMAHGQADSLNVAPVLGFDGFYRPGAWTPVFVDISNQPTAGISLSELRDFDGQLMVTTTPHEGQSAMRFVRSIDIPAASQKRYVLYTRIPAGLASPPLLNLTNQRGRIFRAFQLHTSEVDHDNMLTIEITDRASRPSLPRMRGGLDKMITGRLSPQSLPDHWAGWDAVDMVIISSWPDRGIAPDELQAIRDWVQMGGTLVMLAGSEAASYSDPAARALLPVELTGSTTLVDRGGSIQIGDQLEEGTRSYVLARSEPKAGTETLLSRDGIPLLVREAHGNGQILYLALDFRASSAGVERLFGPTWFSLLPVRDMADWQQNIPRLSGSFQAIGGRAARPPNPLLIIAICVLYTFVVGPLNFSWLSRRKKLEWAWFTLPAIVLAFFVLIYGLGRIIKERSSALRELRVEVYNAGEQLGSFHTFGNIFSAQARRLQLKPADENQVIEDISRWWDYQEFQERPFLSFGRGIFPSAPQARGSLPTLSYDGAGRRISSPSWDIGTYDIRSMAIRGTSRLDGEVQADLILESRGLHGTITNETSRWFEHAWLLHGGRQTYLGAMAPGDQVRVGTGDGDRRFLPGLPRLSGEYSVIPSEDIDPISINNFELILNGMLRPELTGILLPPNHGMVTFVGLHHDEDQDLLGNVPFDQHRRTLSTVVHLQADLQDGEQRFRFVTEELRFKLAGTREISPGHAGELSFRDNASAMELRNRGAVITVELPAYRKGTVVDSITVNTTQSVHPSMEFEVSIFNHDSGNWTSVIPGSPMSNNSNALPGNGRIYLLLEGKLRGTGGNLTWDANVAVDSLEVILAGRITE